jgi:hypothetical protein
MDWHIECDDPKDEDQKRAVERATKCFDAIPHFTSMRYYLGEDKWQGKYGSQLQWGEIQVDGQTMVGVVTHEPVDGDSIVYGYDKTPGILIRSGWVPHRKQDEAYLFKPKSEWLRETDRAQALFLYDQFWRDHFVISNYNPRSADYLYEGDKAAAIFGLGYRGMLYWDFQLREELRSWLIDALQRLGVNGMLYGYFESGNVQMMNEVILALKMLIRDNVTAFPFLKGQTPAKIEHIDPSSVGYDVLAHWIDTLEQTMRRCVLGQSLSSMTGATGMGSEVARLHEQTIQHVIRSDTLSQQETLTRDILGPMVRFNTWEYRGQQLKGRLPFGLRFVYNFEKADVMERAQIISVAYQMGIKMSVEQIQSDLGVSPPKSDEDTIQSPQYLAMQLQVQQAQQQAALQQMQAAMGQAGGMPGGSTPGSAGPTTGMGVSGGMSIPGSAPIGSAYPQIGPISNYVRDLAIGAVRRGVDQPHHLFITRDENGNLTLDKAPMFGAIHQAPIA